MTNEQYIKTLLQLAGMEESTCYAEEFTKDISITIASDYHRKASSVIVAFKDTAPRLQVYAPLGYYQHPITVGCKTFEPCTTGPYQALARFIENFVQSRLCAR